MIVEALNRAYSELSLKERQPFRVRPSNLGDCLRKLAWLQTGVEPLPLDPETIRTFELGTQRGERLEAMAMEVWRGDARTQVPVSVPLGRFKLEGTIDLWLPKENLLVDFKTIGAYGAGLLGEEGPSLEYRLQVHAYRNAIAAQEGIMPSAIMGMLVYEAKDSDARKGVKGGQLIEMEVPWTAELDEVYERRCMDLEGMLIRSAQGTLDPTAYKELPLDDKGKKSWKCRYCSVGEQRGKCYASG